MLLSSQGKAATASASDYVWANNSGPWDTDRLTRTMTAETAKWLGSRLTVAEYRHVAVGIGREIVGERFAAGYDKQPERRFRATAAASTTNELSLGEEYDGEDPVELQNGLTLYTLNPKCVTG
jgi:hypothetical protein